MQLLLNYI